MKLAKDIAMKAKEEFAWTNADGYSDEDLEETISSLEQFISTKLVEIKTILELADEEWECCDIRDGIYKVIGMLEEE